MYNVISIPIDDKYIKKYRNIEKNGFMELDDYYINTTSIDSIQNDLIHIFLNEHHNLNEYNLDDDIYDNLENTYDMDTSRRLAFDPKLENKRINILLHDNYYLGHIYSWKYRDYVLAVGIRTTLDNVVSRKYRGVGMTLIDSLVEYTKLSSSILVIDNPYEIMQSILLKYGFNEEYEFDTKNMIKNVEPHYDLSIWWTK